MTTHQDTGPSGADCRYDAACRGTDPERFFPTASNGPRRHQQEHDAKAVCRACPVVEQCLDWALHSGEDFGVWGGASEAERRSIRRGRRPARTPPTSSAPEPDHELAAPARTAGTVEKRRHALNAVEQRRQPRATVAAAFAVSTRTVDRWLAQERAHAVVAAEPAARAAR